MPVTTPLLLVAFAERGPYLIAVAHLFELDPQGKPVVRPIDRRVSPVKDVTPELLTKAWPHCFAVKFAEKFPRFGLTDFPDVVCVDRGNQSGAVAPDPGLKAGSPRHPHTLPAARAACTAAEVSPAPNRAPPPRGMLDDVAEGGVGVVKIVPLKTSDRSLHHRHRHPTPEYTATVQRNADATSCQRYFPSRLGPK